MLLLNYIFNQLLIFLFSFVCLFVLLQSHSTFPPKIFKPINLSLFQQLTASFASLAKYQTTFFLFFLSFFDSLQIPLFNQDYFYFFHHVCIKLSNHRSHSSRRRCRFSSDDVAAFFLKNK